MSTKSTSSNNIPTFEGLIDKYFWISAALFFLLILAAAVLAAQGDLESEQITNQQKTEMKSWEQGFEQGQQANLSRCPPPITNPRSGDG